ncbi:TA0938 family protein [Metallosphaera tengchongensis]|uniref:TA0938 family protein n=1 Tax=Metallosphaera tengchongensis TaxID=1532350 RepID=A0A6N0P099_9CREN|nr:TA0938 family protein [Metallosphaera tengchongensis]QKR00781.1 TA0938 family protein [Metallosphaera tengchongensis]
MKINIRMEKGNPGERCEYCGVDMAPDSAYVREIHGEKHYFCCSHCADKYEARLK